MKDLPEVNRSQVVAAVVIVVDILDEIVREFRPSDHVGVDSTWAPQMSHKITPILGPESISRKSVLSKHLLIINQIRE